MTLTVSPTGELLLPAELVPAAPNERVEVAQKGNVLVLKPVVSPAIERSSSLTRSIRSLPTLPGTWADPQLTFRREDLYEEDGR